jgi:hypothetical protein
LLRFSKRKKSCDNSGGVLRSGIGMKLDIILSYKKKKKATTNLDLFDS